MRWFCEHSWSLVCPTFCAYGFAKYAASQNRSAWQQSISQKICVFVFIHSCFLSKCCQLLSFCSSLFLEMRKNHQNLCAMILPIDGASVQYVKFFRLAFVAQMVLNQAEMTFICPSYGFVPDYILHFRHIHHMLWKSFQVNNLGPFHSRAAYCCRQLSSWGGDISEVNWE